jgi:hypothetical protein
MSRGADADQKLFTSFSGSIVLGALLIIFGHWKLFDLRRAQVESQFEIWNLEFPINPG